MQTFECVLGNKDSTASPKCANRSEQQCGHLEETLVPVPRPSVGSILLSQDCAQMHPTQGVEQSWKAAFDSSRLSSSHWQLTVWDHARELDNQLMFSNIYKKKHILNQQMEFFGIKWLALVFSFHLNNQLYGREKWRHNWKAILICEKKKIL